MKKLALVIIVAILLAGATFYVAKPRQPAPSTLGQNMIGVTQTLAPPFVMFRTLAPADRYGRLAMVPVSTPDATRAFSQLECARVHFAGGAGVCLVEEPGDRQVVHAAYFFDRSFTRGSRLLLSGVPTRVRVSPDGRRAAITVYGEEHTADGQERLASDSILVDLPSGRVLTTLRQFAFDRTGKLAPDAPLDYSSVAFDANGDNFYATLNSTTLWFIVSGSVSSRRLTVVAEGFGSEAISPDGGRLAAKQRVGERGFWQAMVFDLTTKIAKPLDHARSIDDQIEWLDRDNITYHDATERGTGIWALAADGRSGPRLLIPDAYSPAVQH